MSMYLSSRRSMGAGFRSGSLYKQATASSTASQIRSKTEMALFSVLVVLFADCSKSESESEDTSHGESSSLLPSLIELLLEGLARLCCPDSIHCFACDNWDPRILRTLSV